MIYELQSLSPLDLPNIFGGLPSRMVGLALWALLTYIAAIYAVRTRGREVSFWTGIPVPLLLAAGIYTGLFINLYRVIDEVSINLEHPYNLFHYGRFSMSPEKWADGTVEVVFYLLHTPFAGSQHSLILANYGICYLIGLLHLPLVYRLLDTKTDSARRTLQICAFALCGPLVFIFASGFGNGLVSLMFLASMSAALRGSVAGSLAISGLLPLLRPDAVFLACVNPLVIALDGWIRREPSVLRKRHLPLLALPVAALAVYYLFFRIAFGHWVPIPIRFKAFNPAMLSMFSPLQFGLTWAGYLLSPPHVIGLVFLVVFCWHWRRQGVQALVAEVGRRPLAFALYSLATLPLLLFYTFVHATIIDWSLGTYARYWISFDLCLLLFTLSVLPAWRKIVPRALKLVPGGIAPHFISAGANLVFLSLSIPLLTATLQYTESIGRLDGMFAGTMVERYFPRELSVSSSEMNTFGLMIERPVIDLWGYTSPAIALSKTCNAEKIRSNPQYFSTVKPDVYWQPYHLYDSNEDAFASVERYFATFYNTSKVGNLTGDMNRVLADYDVLEIKANHNQAVFLVRKSSRDPLLEHLFHSGFVKSREREINMPVFRKMYGNNVPFTYRCG